MDYDFCDFRRTRYLQRGTLQPPCKEDVGTNLLDSILLWTNSSLANGRAEFRYTDGVTTERELACGNSQGSPILPVLFLLHMAEPMDSGKDNLRSSYADDVGILGFYPTTAESAAAAKIEVNHLLEWARKNTVALDTVTSEVVQFPDRRCETAVGMHFNGTLIEPADHIR